MASAVGPGDEDVEDDVDLRDDWRLGLVRRMGVCVRRDGERVVAWEYREGVDQWGFGRWMGAWKSLPLPFGF